MVREWRRTRPFWAGLLLILGGTELLLVPLSPLTVLVSLGLGGIAAIGIGIALVVAGGFLWLLPHTRHYVSLNALILSVLSFAATNLGGFVVGMALGIAGSAMGFGWTPTPDDAAGRTKVRDHQGTRTLAVLLPRRSPVRWLYGLVGLPDRHWRVEPGAGESRVTSVRPA
ncbi:DUF6114 domain-containing protein [Streptomyces sp. NPDC090032]|uniref:DUF6114 domain-containing protein n=1 Tax=Streptomyces sp. NPDC090032 TaxID=3365925 RepID=UPI00382A96ED